MPFIIVFEALVITGILALAVTQVFVPLLRGTPLFPFRFLERKLNKLQAQQNQALVEQELATQLKEQSKGLVGAPEDGEQK